MFRQQLSLSIVLLVFCAMVGAQSGPPDGMPDISGTWEGTLKAKSWDQHPNPDEFGKGKVPIRIDVNQNGSDVTFRLYAPDDQGTRKFEFDGQVGNGNAWAVASGPDLIMMLSAHVKKDKMKGVLVSAEDNNIAEGTFKLKRMGGGPLTTVDGTPSGSKDGLPSIDGTWTGKHKYTGYAMFTPGHGEKSKEKGKDAIEVLISQMGSDISFTYTVLADGGPETIPMSGEHGNGHFYAFGMHPTGGPVLAVGHVKKNKIKGQGIVTFDSAVFEFKFTVKAPK